LFLFSGRRGEEIREKISQNQGESLPKPEENL